MRAYQLIPAEGAARISVLNHEKLIESALEEPQRLPDTIKLRASIRDGDQSLKLLDVAFIETSRSLLVFSKALYEQLLSAVDVSAQLAPVQWVPIEVDGQACFLMNFTDVINAIDPDKSAIEYGNANTVYKADELVLCEDAIGDRWLYRDRITAAKAITCTNLFFNWFNENGFTGLEFIPVYDSDHAPFKLGAGTKDAIARPEVYGPDGFFPGYEHLWSAQYAHLHEKKTAPVMPDEVTVAVVPFHNERVKNVASRLTMYGIGSDSQLNRVTLPLNEQSPGAHQRTPYSLTEKQAYFDFINDIFMHAAGPDNAQSALEYIREELLRGRRDFGIDQQSIDNQQRSNNN